MKFLEKPNLPTKKIKYAICDNRIGDNIKSELGALGCNIFYVSPDSSLDTPISAHPDIHIYHKGNGDFLTSSYYHDEFNKVINSLLNKIDCEKFNNTKEECTIKKGYPNDVLLNVAKIGKYIICNKKNISKQILSEVDASFINVKQGYAKCSICVVSENAIITDDPGVYKCTNKHLDTLLIKHGEIVLNGYNYGFFGGSCGKISNDTLAFYGSIERLSNYDAISAFCKNHGVFCYSLSKDTLTDYGSLIPIIE